MRALVRAASEQDGALFLTAAFTGLRLGELLALRWRDVDFAGFTVRVRTSWAGGVLTTPKSAKVRSVPPAQDVASALARLGDREHWTGDDDLVFAGEAGSYLDTTRRARRTRGSSQRPCHCPRPPILIGSARAPESADLQVLVPSRPKSSCGSIAGHRLSQSTMRRILSNDGGFGLGGTSAGRLQHGSAWSVCLCLWLWRYSESWARRRERGSG